ncbi:MAG: bioD [Rhizobacter sp.]|nr:bioD [Rhizobacter sp.]
MSQCTFPKGCFVTGTDTGVGKTGISAALLHRAARSGAIVSGFKPVAAGTSLISGTWVNEDVRLLREASSAGLADADVGPFQFDMACAPHVAAVLEGRPIGRAAILASGRALLARSDFVVVEGVGGFRVPLGPDWDSTQLARDLALPLILVVGLRLGCLNHALLTVEAIQARHLPLAGWIANTIDPNMAFPAHTVSTLHRELDERQEVPCLGVVPWLDRPSPQAIASHLSDLAWRSAFGPQGRAAGADIADFA